jgi:signal transduction histidine kinase
VSHELRTPLTIMANAVALLERRRDQLPEVAQEAVQMLES